MPTPTKLSVPAKLPTTLGGLQTRYAKLRAEDAAFKAHVKKIGEALDETLLAMEAAMKKQRIDLREGSRGSGFMFRQESKEVGKYIDKEAFIEHVFKSGELDLLSGSPALTPCRERWASHEQVPGVERVEITELKARKLPKS